jgi:hypothetical protein
VDEYAVIQELTAGSLARSHFEPTIVPTGGMSLKRVTFASEIHRLLSPQVDDWPRSLDHERQPARTLISPIHGRISVSRERS